MTYGLRQAGIDVIAGVDFENSLKETYESNNPGTRFIYSDIKRLRSNYFERHFNLRRYEDDLILVGCSPCQYYSIINTERTKSQKTKNLLLSFYRFVDYYRPGFVLVENVPGIEFAKDSVLPIFLKKLSSIDYRVEKKVVDLSYFGVPQSRITQTNITLSWCLGWGCRDGGGRVWWIMRGLRCWGGGTM